jgi:predicted AlkP superfamily pyrophosphatase or phosphodiesterase
MRRGSLLLVLLVSCTSGAPRDLARRTASRVVLLSFDGLGADAMARHTDLPAFAQLERDGMFVERVTPVTPCQTSSAHVAILTGAPPRVTGIVANKFHKPGTPWTEVADGFSADIDAETLIQAAHRAGKRVGSIAFPTVDTRRPADFGIVYSDAIVRSRIIHLTRSDFRSEWMPPGWGERPSRHISYSPVLRAPIEWMRSEVDIVAYDTTDDHVRNYDAFFVEKRDAEVAPDSRGWFSISSRTPDALYGSWSKLMRTTATLDDIAIYWGGIHGTAGYPDSFRQMIDDEAGFWPGAPDERFAQEHIEGRDGIDGDTFAEQNERFAQFFASATALAIRRMPFDLLLAYEPIIDKAEHQFLISSDAQAYATAENRAIGESVRARTFIAADRALKTIGDALDPSQDALVVTGDHGLAPIDAEVHLKRLLAEWGLDQQWVAFASGGGVAHLYRIAGGAASELAAHFKDTGFIERIDAKSHPNSGDLVLYAYPHVGLSASGGEAVTKPHTYGQHGGIGSHAEFQTVLIAWGAGVPHGVVPESSQTQIAGYVAALLGMDPPQKADRAPITP